MFRVKLLTLLKCAVLASSQVFRSRLQFDQTQQHLNINNEQILLIKHELDYISACIAKLKYRSKLITESITVQEQLAIAALSQGKDSSAYTIAEIIAAKENEQSCLTKQLTIMQASQLKLTQRLSLYMKHRLET